MGKRSALGRGLGALIPGADSESKSEAYSPDRESVAQIELDKITPNPHQPRKEFDPTSVKELARSISEKGVLQPICVRAYGTGFQLIVGERRLRAAKQANLKTIPAILMDVRSDEELMEISLIENVQREDLNPIEEAAAYRSLMDDCFLTQEEVAQKVGKERSTIANTLRLLNLAPDVQSALASNRISMGHARALLGLDDERMQGSLCKTIVSEGLSVRNVESLVRSRKGESGRKPVKSEKRKDPQIVSLEENLQRRFGTGVHINQRGKVGKIEIEFYSDDDLERILDLLHEPAY